ncbi:hypothetical protein BM1_02747 [Bipolaris maydis]|nr:hypothetical protein BM1_02747 [Bipolaris maydis]
MFQPSATLIEPQHFPRIAPAREVGRELGVGPRKYNESRNNISRPTDPDIKPWLHMPQPPTCISAAARTFSQASRFWPLIGPPSDYSRYHETMAVQIRSEQE